MSDEPILTIVEELKGRQFKDYSSRMYDPNFWLPMIPLKNKQIDVISLKTKYAFSVHDVIELDPLGTLKKELNANGTLEVFDRGQDGTKGMLWEMILLSPNLKAEVHVRLRVKDIPDAIKIGLFITKLEYDQSLTMGFGRDAILFATRVKLRVFLQEVQKRGAM
jgi:hypothetical protein